MLDFSIFEEVLRSAIRHHMDLPPSSSRNFSTIARRLLLERGCNGNTERVLSSCLSHPDSEYVFDQPTLNAHDILSANTSSEGSHEPVLFLSPNTTESKEPMDEMDAADLLSGGKEDPDSPAAPQFLPVFPSQPHASEAGVFLPHSSTEESLSYSGSGLTMHPAGRNTNRLEVRLRALRAEDLKAPLEGSYNVVRSDNTVAVGRPYLGKSAKVVIRRVRQFFDELKRLLGNSCDGTIFAASVKMTALACGVSTNTVRRLGVKNKFVYELFPRKEKNSQQSEDAREEATLRKFGVEWGPIVKWFIREKLKKDRRTITALHKAMCEAYADFPMSESTLRRFVKAIGVTFGVDKGVPYMIV